MTRVHFRPAPVLAAAFAAILLFAACDDSSTNAKKDPPVVTTLTYLGVLTDSVVRAQFQAAGMVYIGSTFTYKLVPDSSTFRVYLNVGFGPALSETGTYARTGDTVRFSPVTNSVNNSRTHQMEPAATIRPAYAGVRSADSTTITIANFINIGDQRNLGTLTVTKQ